MLKLRQPNNLTGKRIDDEVKKQMVADYEAGMRIKDILAKHSVSLRGFYRNLHKAMGKQQEEQTAIA